ncbi:hypothetical protein [Anianabacter salinae]|uniref:hypothetical protein n=1 Tax=Anianabacter salinae TaxID=2851023 RepID=UPI00225DF6A2|nr:hypothetical protein [Anianabacter salinae]MBV0911431.1 hypothetical protein [Anianabacter salinae]
MGAVTVSLWVVLVGAVAGAAAVYGARGRNRFVSGAIIGAVVALLMSILRGFV